MVGLPVSLHSGRRENLYVTARPRSLAAPGGAVIGQGGWAEVKMGRVKWARGKSRSWNLAVTGGAG